MAATAKKKFPVTMAEKADIHELYERSVQAVDVEASSCETRFARCAAARR